MLHITPNLYHCDKKRQKEIKRDKRFYGKYPLKAQFFPALAYHYIRILAARDLNSRKRVFLAFLCLRVALGGAYGSHSGFEFGNKLVESYTQGEGLSDCLSLNPLCKSDTACR